MNDVTVIATQKLDDKDKQVGIFFDRNRLRGEHEVRPYAPPNVGANLVFAPVPKSCGSTALYTSRGSGFNFSEGLKIPCKQCLREI
ncbi:MAG: hypothetical protein BECKG1743F_GA0114225_101585, partial [Candidatus Kentron sp. G]